MAIGASLGTERVGTLGPDGSLVCTHGRSRLENLSIETCPHHAVIPNSLTLLPTLISRLGKERVRTGWNSSIRWKTWWDLGMDGASEEDHGWNGGRGVLYLLPSSQNHMVFHCCQSILLWQHQNSCVKTFINTWQLNVIKCGILTQNQDTGGNTGEIWVRSLDYFIMWHQCSCSGLIIPLVYTGSQVKVYRISLY